ncbi:MAG: hypothetical protein PHV98_04275 [Candidatus Omnitrophica bacterium]|nr:hypothetical protein [Candidatus Omnitrophota bacterium]
MSKPQGASPFLFAMDNKRLESKFKKEDSEYRLKRLLEILLEADLKVLEDIIQKEKGGRLPSLKLNSKINLTDAV